jgi:hypothetical protein
MLLDLILFIDGMVVIL